MEKMEILPSKSAKTLELAVKILQKCGIVVFPTETVYGMGALPSCVSAIRKIYELKKRDFTKPMLLHVPSQERAFRYIETLDERVKKLVEKFWPGPLSIVVKASRQTPEYAVARDGTVGLRMPSEEFFLKMAEETGPILATSANISGFSPSVTIEEALAQFADEVPLYVDAGRRSSNKASTVINMTKRLPLVVRIGALSVQEIENVIGEVAVLI